MKRLIAGFVLLTVSLLASAQEITYRKHIRPLWEDKCERCHGSVAPYLGSFEEDKKAYEADDKGPRMDSYADLIFFIGWPDTGAIMRRLDDGKSKNDGIAGNMYKRLGKNEEERQANLKLFKQWVGEDAWTMKKPKEITKEELMRIKTPY
ncbi:MAG: cytochrome C [Sulfuritalea sp.]|nr:cytochrome C [Sulfuritalea sp.]